MSDIYSGNVYVQIKSPCEKRFPSPLMNALNINSSHSLTKCSQPANLTYTILSLFSLQYNTLWVFNAPYTRNRTCGTRSSSVVTLA